MEKIFETHYSIGDRVKIRKGEHNDNWAGKIVKIVEIGVDLHEAAYIVKFKNEIYRPCFLRKDLKPVYRKNNLNNKIIFNTKFNIGDKVKVFSLAKSLKSSVLAENEPLNIYIDNHMTLEEINYFYENKLGWCSPEEYHWFNNMFCYLNLTENEPEIWKDKVGEVIKKIPCFLESDLELMK